MVIDPNLDLKNFFLNFGRHGSKKINKIVIPCALGRKLMTYEEIDIVRNKIIDTIHHHQEMEKAWKKCEEFLRNEIQKNA